MTDTTLTRVYLLLLPVAGVVLGLSIAHGDVASAVIFAVLLVTGVLIGWLTFAKPFARAVTVTHYSIVCAAGRNGPIGVPYGAVDVKPDPDAITAAQAEEWRKAFERSPSHGLACGPHRVETRTVTHGYSRWS